VHSRTSMLVVLLPAQRWPSFRQSLQVFVGLVNNILYVVDLGFTQINPLPLINYFLGWVVGQTVHIILYNFINYKLQTYE